MLLVADVKSLEVVTCAFLSQDTVLCDEVRARKKFHDDNQTRFALPDRVTAKRFVFKLIYGATAYGYTMDGDFQHVGFSQDKWQGVIDEFYVKYRGVGEWHKDLVQGALTNGRFTSPSGRVYSYPSEDVARRLWFWRPKILNYPVQGLGADLVMLARIALWRRLSQIPERAVILPVSSVHDSIVLDLPNELVSVVAPILSACVEDIPKNFQRCFGQEFNLPMSAELKIGNNLGDMIPWG